MKSVKYTNSLIAALVLVSAGLASVCGQPTAGVVAANITLPPGVWEQLEKQKVAMRTMFLESTEVALGSNAASYGGQPTYSAYFETNRFYESNPIREVAFDGSIIWVGNPPVGREAILAKYLAADATDPELRNRKWEFPYLDAASIYAPMYSFELQQFSSLEPLVMHCLKQSHSTRVERLGENLQVTCRINDPFLANQREIDADWFQTQIRSPPNPPEFVAAQVENLKRQQTMTPTRTIAFLLAPEYRYAVVEREEWTATGQRIVRIQAEAWKFYASQGIWLPSRCVTTYYTPPFQFTEFSDQPVLTIMHELKLVEFGQKKFQFALAQKTDYKKPGTVVIDRTLPEAQARPNRTVAFTVAANGELLRESAENVKSLGRIWVFFLVILGFLPVILFFRHRRKSGKV